MLPPRQADEVLRNRYRVRQVVGQGGMGSIYLAEDAVLAGRLCAVKEIRTDPTLPEAAQQQAREQFHREASILARLDHPNLPKVSDFFADGDRAYLVMDYVAGQDLKTVMDEARRGGRILPEAEVLDWAGQLLDALAYLHGQQPPVLHRDIKPGNIRITPNGVLKLVDFGLVKLLAPDEMTITVVQGRGTALYTPLEQYGGDSGHTDARSDIYSSGATLYHLLTNQPPPEARARFLRPETLTPLHHLNPEISPRTERAVLWAMAIHPDDRPSGVEEFRGALFGDLGPPLRGAVRQRPNPIESALPHTADRALALTAFGLLLLALLATLFSQGAP